MGSISIPTVAVAGEVAVDEAAADAAVAAAADTAVTVAAADTAATAATAAAATASSGSVFGTIASGASIAGGLAGAYQTHQAGVATANQAKLQQRQAALEAGQKQISIRENMLRALASQNAQAGVGGIGTGGSFGANVKRQISQNQNDLMALSANSSLQQQQYGSQANAALTGGNVKAGASLLDLAGGPNGLG